MKQVTIAIDIDGTLISNTSDTTSRGGVVANERIRTLLIILSTFKNVKIIVWSGGGELYARQCAREIGIDKYVDGYASKNLIGRDSDGKLQFAPDIQPDIAVDDIQDCTLGKINLICREK